MNAIERCFERLKDRREGALITYVSGGDPNPEQTPEIIESLIRGGADIIELGIPFSDPIADGPTIQAASVRALKAGTTPRMVLEIAGKVKEINNSIPLVLLSYYNPIFRMGLKEFFSLSGSYGIDGIIIPDLPVEESQEYTRIAEDHEIATIFMMTPNTTTDRLDQIIESTSGFLYMVSIYGVTGAREKIRQLTLNTLHRIIPQIGGRIPLAVGFGISEPEHVRTLITNGADGVIVGSAIVDIVEKHRDNPDYITETLEQYTRKLKAGTL
jgi:tryptophan synthase alpha chain